MRIGFYAPLKHPAHPVVSGDRQMARLLIKALELAGHEVSIASNLRVFLKNGNPQIEAELRATAMTEKNRLLSRWHHGDKDAPQLWFTYHPYYKSPDWLGPPISRDLNIPYVTAEASWAGKRRSGLWAAAQKDVGVALHLANVNFCMTRRDRDGLEDLLGEPPNLVDLPPFINLSMFPTVRERPHKTPVRLLTVAMMRDDVKRDSYRFLARALATIADEDWRLDIVGDGAARQEIETAFSTLPPGRIKWAGETTPEALTAHYAGADIFVWPGIGEAYGMAYLEAQAMGLPVVALNTAGVPSVVAHGVSGLLTPPGDVSAYGKAIARLVDDAPHRAKMGKAASDNMRTQHSLESAARCIHSALQAHIGEKT